MCRNSANEIGYEPLVLYVRDENVFVAACIWKYYMKIGELIWNVVAAILDGMESVIRLYLLTEISVFIDQSASRRLWVKYK
jgi:hypothetical protein